MAKGMTHKVADIDLGNGWNVTCINHTEDSINPFWLYLNWYDTRQHHKLIVKYADMVSVLCHITNYLRQG